MKRKSVLIATPAFGSQVFLGYMHSIINTLDALRERNVRADIFTLGKESLIARARNTCAEYALNNGYDCIFFIDADLRWTPEDFLRVFDSDKSIIGGTYPLKTFPLMINFNPLNEQREEFGRRRGQDEYFAFIKKYAQANGEVEVAHIPTGFMLIDCSVLRDLETKTEIKKYVTHHHETGVTKHYAEFFPCGPAGDGLYKSEDWAFCEIANYFGHKIYLQTKSICSHTGTHEYGLGQHVIIGQRPLIPEGENNKL